MKEDTSEQRQQDKGAGSSQVGRDYKLLRKNICCKEKLGRYEVRTFTDILQSV